MKLQSIIIDLLILTAVTGMYNEFGLVGGKSYNPNFNVSESAVNGITQVDGSDQIQEKGFWESILPGGVYWLLKSVGFILSLIWMVLNAGSLIPEYIPGPVGDAFGLIFNGLMLFIVGWSAVQIYMKISTKNMD